MTGRFVDRLVLVTGAAGGLGRALALGYAREGAKLALLDLDAAGLAATGAQLGDFGTAFSTHIVNLADEGEILAFGRQFCAEHDQLHVLYNNAGIAYGEISQSFATLSQEKWLRYMAVNAIAPLILAQALRAPLAKAQGVILNQSSMSSYVPAVAYGVTKATLNAMTYGMAQTFAADGIRVNAIAPGIMETEASMASLPAETVTRIRGMQLLSQHGTPEHIVSLALFLASDDARFITCEIVSCDGGSRLKGWRG